MQAFASKNATVVAEFFNGTVSRSCVPPAITNFRPFSPPARAVAIATSFAALLY
jgi:hypothetical protein